MTSYTHELPQTIILTGGTSGLGYAYARSPPLTPIGTSSLPAATSFKASGQ